MGGGVNEERQGLPACQCHRLPACHPPCRAGARQRLQRGVHNGRHAGEQPPGRAAGPVLPAGAVLRRLPSVAGRCVWHKGTPPVQVEGHAVQALATPAAAARVAPCQPAPTRLPSPSRRPGIPHSFRSLSLLARCFPQPNPTTILRSALLCVAVVTRAIALFGCEFFLSYGMTECCGKISMSILPPGAPAGMPSETGPGVCGRARAPLWPVLLCCWTLCDILALHQPPGN